MKSKNISTSRIEDAIANFEAAVDFEFVPVIAKKSSYVEHISWVLSLLFLVIFIGLIDFIFRSHLSDSWMSPAPFYIAAPFVAFACGVVLDKLDWVDRFFISRSERNRQVHEKAERIFFQQSLHALKSQNALLLYISIMERRIVLLHDPRIQFQNMQQIDEELLKILQTSFKNCDFEEGLVKAIEHLKNRLLPHFGYKNDQKKGENSVPNKLIWLNE